MRPVYTIRGYLKHDRQRCMEILSDNCPTYFRHGDELLFDRWLTAQEQGKQASANSFGDFYYVVLKDFNVVACGGFYLEDYDVSAHISWLMVDPSSKGQGVGHKLSAYVLEQVNLLFPESLVHVKTTENCTTFFEKMGFKNGQTMVSSAEGKRDHVSMILRR